MKKGTSPGFARKTGSGTWWCTPRWGRRSGGSWGGLGHSQHLGRRQTKWLFSLGIGIFITVWMNQGESSDSWSQSRISITRFRAMKCSISLGGLCIEPFTTPGLLATLTPLRFRATLSSLDPSLQNTWSGSWTRSKSQFGQDSRSASNLISGICPP